MQPINKMDMLLFCKERTNNPREYVLYFTTLDTLSSPAPKVHRAVVRTQKAFERFVLGGVYDLELNKNMIKTATKVDTFNVTDQLYLTLLELRELRFADPRTSYKRKGKNPILFHPDQYYSFQEAKEILSYSPSFFNRLFMRLFELLSYIIAMIIPFILYGLLVYAYVIEIIKSPLTTTLAQTLNIPIIVIGALPMMVSLMTFAFVYSEIILLNFPYTRWYLIKRYVLLWCGMRKGINLPDRELKRLLRFIIVSAIILAVSFIITLLLPLFVK